MGESSLRKKARLLYLLSFSFQAQLYYRVHCRGDCRLLHLERFISLGGEDFVFGVGVHFQRELLPVPAIRWHSGGLKVG